jgi:opacity protein-like surface antigen
MRIASAAALIFLTAASASAQEDAGAVVAGGISVTAMSSTNSLTFSGSGGYRFNRYFGLEVEVTVLPTLKAPFRDASGPVIQTSTADVVALTGGIFSLGGVALPSSLYPGLSYTNENGRAVFFTNNVRVEMPTASDRLTPFFVAGGGAVNVRQSADLTLPIGIALPPTASGTPAIRTVTEHVSASSTDLAVTIGGGVEIKFASHASIDADLRYVRILGETDRNVGRFGVGVRYRF